MEEYSKAISEREWEQSMREKAESYSDFLNDPDRGQKEVFGESPCEVCPDLPWCEQKEDEQ